MAEAAVFNLIKTQNKPFGVQGLVDNLQTAGIKKAAVQKTVDVLTDSGKITCKVCAGSAIGGFNPLITRP
jgi:23S rRNA U2552 (ribose-2'-O)-methylase RlmE/FtsJ